MLPGMENVILHRTHWISLGNKRQDSGFLSLHTISFIIAQVTIIPAQKLFVTAPLKDRWQIRKKTSVRSRLSILITDLVSLKTFLQILFPFPMQNFHSQKIRVKPGWLQSYKNRTSSDRCG